MKSKGETEREATNANPEQKHWDRNVEVRMATAAEQEWFDTQLHERHYLGSGHPVGDYLRQIVERGGRAVWRCWRGVRPATRSRTGTGGWAGMRPAGSSGFPWWCKTAAFYCSPSAAEEPNFASQVLAAAVRTLPGHWQERFGYRPLLAETFTDPEAYQGTCYKASAWEPVGTSQGYERHRGDFYREHGKPKHLWLLRPLHPSAKALLSAPDPALPEDCRAGLRRAPTGTLPLKNGQLPSLLEALCGMPDPRAKNTRFKIGPVLGRVALALLAGRRDIASIARMANLLDQDQRFALALPREAGKKVRLAPSYSVFYDVLTRLDPEAFAQALTTVGSQPTPVPCPERSPWTESLFATRSGCSAWSRPTPARRSPWPSSIKRKTPRAVNRPAPVRCWPPRRWTSRSSHRRRLARHPRAGPHHRGKRRRVCAPDQRQPTPAERAGPARPDRSTPLF
ncbi:MAG: DUF4338 domain-containing protein [Candidatus Synoicihabitans palmerolidicus]|nr:DUF4338 domain-containing protein [Candidatus Synoicihabitans palmerolidicus]